MTRDGVIVITANRFRTQEQNRRDALDRLVELIRKAAVPPIRRRPTKPSKASKQRLQDSKHHQSSLKKERGKISHFDWRDISALPPLIVTRGVVNSRRRGSGGERVASDAELVTLEGRRVLNKMGPCERRRGGELPRAIG
jgi:hypothetical protein